MPFLKFIIVLLFPFLYLYIFFLKNTILVNLKIIIKPFIVYLIFYTFPFMYEGHTQETKKIRYLENVLQNASSAKNPGVYSQVVLASNTVLKPGEYFTIDYYITGYGDIDYKSAKLFYSSSSDIFEKSKSIIISDFKFLENGIYVWGGQKTPLLKSGFVLFHGSSLVDSTGQTYMTWFNDFQHAFPEKKYEPTEFLNKVVSKHQSEVPNNSTINSEITMGYGSSPEMPPIQIIAKLKDNVLPGEYTYSFTMTYFNGEKWENDKTEIKLNVMTWYERNASLIQYLALIIACLTILTLIRPALKEVMYIYTKAGKFYTKKSKSQESAQKKETSYEKNVDLTEKKVKKEPNNIKPDKPKRMKLNFKRRKR